MKNLLLLLLLCSPFLAFAQQIDTKLLQGQWVLADIQSTDSIWVAVDANAQLPVTSKGKQVTTEYQEKKISIVEYMQKDLTCGVTRFVFQGNTFQFFRGQKLTFSGTVKVKGQKLLLEYNNGENKNSKENTIISLTAGKLVLGTQSKEKPVNLSFIKK